MYPTTRDHGAIELVYRYTVSGSDKASIDTGADTAQAGTNDFTNGDVLEVYLHGRTDEAVRLSVVALTFNNDTGANYDRAFLATSAASTTPTGDQSVAASNAVLVIAGDSNAANVAGLMNIVIPDYRNATFYKNAIGQGSVTDTAAANANRQSFSTLYQWRSTSAISRIAVTPATAAKNFKVGTTLLIYKRLA